MADNTIKIGGELESMATGKIVAAASAIKDKSRNKTQETINGDVEQALNFQTSRIDDTNAKVAINAQEIDSVRELIETHEFEQGVVQYADAVYCAVGYLVSANVQAALGELAKKVFPLAATIDGMPSLEENQTGAPELEITDENDYAVVQFKNGYVKTKNFDSQKASCSEDNETPVDFEISDDNNHSIAQFSGGEFKTKNFDSRKVASSEDNETPVDFEISDDSNHSIAQFVRGYIKTKNFDSQKASCSEDNENSVDFEIVDERGRAIVRFQNGHIKTQKFDSGQGVTSGVPLFTEKFKKIKLAIIGDSISTFSGWLPSDIQGYTGAKYAAYYPHGTLTDVNMTWWYKVAAALGLDPSKDVSNCAWSGSRVTGNSLSTTNASAGCSTRRINDITLRLNGSAPDIIICFISCNDWGNEIPLGNWKVTDPIPEEGTITEARAAYALMLHKLHTSYPKTRIFCCTCLDDYYRDESPKAWPPNNEDGVSMHEWNESIREIASAFGCDIIEMNRCGVNYSNIRNYYAVDSGLHPNEEGHSLMARKVVAELFAKY